MQRSITINIDEVHITLVCYQQLDNLQMACRTHHSQPHSDAIAYTLLYLTATVSLGRCYYSKPFTDCLTDSYTLVPITKIDGGHHYTTDHYTTRAAHLAQKQASKKYI